MNEASLTPERILQTATAGWAAAVLGAGVIHSVFTHVEGGIDTPEALADKADLSPRGAGALLDGLVSLGFLTVSNGRYRNAPDAAEFLVEGKQTYFGGFPKVMLAELSDWPALPDVVRTGKPTISETADLPENPFWEQLVPAIAILAVPVALAAAERLKLAEAGPVSILDVGGGSGVYSTIWLGLNRQARSTQIDWPNVNRIARESLARQGLADRFRPVDGDFHVADFGTAEYDVGVYSHIAHQESPAENVLLFRKLRKALKAGGTLVISDFVVDDDRSGPPFPLLFRSEMLLRTKEGSTWRRSDYQGWLREAGFWTVSFETTPSPVTLVYAS
ncbi:MAG TPA: methyltransferase [Thermoanaerobaculia bacterium]